MKTKIVFLLILAVIVNACNKGEYATKPKLTLVSVSNKTISAFQNRLSFVFNFTDKEGDIDSLYIKRCTKVCADTSNTGFSLVKTYDTISIPYFPATKYQKGQLTVNYIYGVSDSSFITLNSCISTDGLHTKTDTSYFLFCLKDAGKHLSDTVRSPDITILK